MWTVVYSVDGMMFGVSGFGKYLEGSSRELIKIYCAHAMNIDVTLFNAI
jgi:hypothetical protein